MRIFLAWPTWPKTHWALSTLLAKNVGLKVYQDQNYHHDQPCSHAYIFPYDIWSYVQAMGPPATWCSSRKPESHLGVDGGGGLGLTIGRLILCLKDTFEAWKKLQLLVMLFIFSSHFGIFWMYQLGMQNVPQIPELRIINHYQFSRFCWACICPMLSYRFHAGVGDSDVLHEFLGWCVLDATLDSPTILRTWYFFIPVEYLSWVYPNQIWTIFVSCKIL